MEILEFQLQNSRISNVNLQAELDSKKIELEEIIKNEAEGAFVRSRAQYKLEGEKPSKLFCSLEKHNGVQRYVPQVLVDQGNGHEALIKEQSKVEGEIFRFYKDLFSNKDDQIQSQSIETFLGRCSQGIPKLSD